MTGPLPVTAERAARLAAAAVLSALAGLSYGTVFAGGGFVPAVLGAALLPVAVIAALAGALRRPARSREGWSTRWPLRWAVLLAAVTGYVTLVAASPAGLVDGPKRLLTAALPVDPTGPELAVVVVVVALAAALAAELAVSRRPALAVAVPPLGCLAVALAVGAAGEPLSRWVPVLVVAAAGLLLLAAPALSAPHEDSGREPVGSGRLAGAAEASRPRAVPVTRGVAAVLVVAVAAALAAAFGPSLPGAAARSERFDARDLVAAPVVPRSLVSPLSRFPALHTGPDTTLFLARTGGAPPVFRTVALDRFDGRLWSSSAAYRRAGRTLPPGPSSGVPTRRFRESFTVRDEAALTWLPVAGRAVTLRPDPPVEGGIGVDQATGDLVVAQGRTGPSSYDAEAVLPSYSAAALTGAVVAPVPDRDRPRDLPAALRSAAAAATGSATSGFGRLAALQASLRGGGHVVDDSPQQPGGHGVFQISRLLATKRGTAEQYASAYAVLARQLGYDARVVVGFRARRPAQDGVYRVTARDVHAWPEVRVVGLGWVPFEPTPVARRTTTGAQSPPPPAADPVVQAAVDAETRRQQARPAAGRSGPPSPTVDGGRDEGRPLWSVVLLAVVVVVPVAVVSTCLLVPLAKAIRRRRRRRAASAGARVTGAWHEALDRLADSGMPRRPSMSTGEVVRVSSRGLGAERVSALVPLTRLADAAHFSREGAAAEQAEAAWRAVDDLRRGLRRGVPVHRRAAGAVDPRSLVRRG